MHQAIRRHPVTQVGRQEQRSGSVRSYMWVVSNFLVITRLSIGLKPTGCQSCDSPGGSRRRHTSVRIPLLLFLIGADALSGGGEAAQHDAGGRRRIDDGEKFFTAGAQEFVGLGLLGGVDLEVFDERILFH